MPPRPIQAKEKPEMSEQVKTKTIALNRQARHEYFVLESLETGIELVGTEVEKPAHGSGESERRLV